MSSVTYKSWHKFKSFPLLCKVLRKWNVNMLYFQNKKQMFSGFLEFRAWTIFICNFSLAIRFRLYSNKSMWNWSQKSKKHRSQIVGSPQKHHGIRDRFMEASFKDDGAPTKKDVDISNRRCFLCKNIRIRMNTWKENTYLLINMLMVNFLKVF